MSVRITCSECGWRSSACRSQTQAEYALRKHSCTKELARQASARRGRARKAAVDRTPKPCLHKIAEHVHGTHACYVLDRCKCPPCAAANAAYEHRRAKDRAYGRQAYVDAEPTRQHVLALRAAGMGIKTIAAVSGVPHGAVTKLIYGDPRRNMAPSKRIRWETAVKLQVVRPSVDTLAAGAMVDPTGTRRRVQALVALGWSQSKLADRLGIARSNFGHTLHNARVTVRTARAVAALYDELWETLPPHAEWRDKIALSRTLRYAREHNFAPPMAWDADTIDDPAATPQGWTPPTARCEDCGRVFGNRGALISHAKLRHGKDVRDSGTDPTADGWDELDQATAAEPDAGELLDEVLVERIMAGTYRVPTNAQFPEKREAIRRLAARGLPDSEIADRLGTTTSNVGWTRNRHGIPAGVPSSRNRTNSEQQIAAIAAGTNESEDGVSHLLEEAQIA